MFAVLVVALLVTLAVAIVGWFRPVPAKAPPPPTYSSQQIGDAKAKVCAAFKKVDNAISTTSARDKGTDYTTQLASAINVRQSLVAGSQYLSTVLNEEPATPTDITANIRNIVNAYQLLAIELLSDAPEAEKSPAVNSGEKATSALENLCK